MIFIIIAHGGPYSSTQIACRFSLSLKTNGRTDIASYAKAKSHWPHNYSLPHDISVTNRKGRSETKGTKTLRSGPLINPLF